MQYEGVDAATPGRLAPIERSNWRRALEVRVTDAQLSLVADHQPIVLVVLAKSFVGAGGWNWEPLAYETNDGEIAAVLGLAHDRSSSQLFNLAVDHRRQRSGIGTAVMMAVIEHVRRRSSSSLSLTVHPDNLAAQALYRKVGFVPTGEIQDGEPVWTIQL
ncbi:MAG: GNAT family N-acetyltransferase [bacterium]|nr:GNAT family N-acetyltransferase [bacterium]